MFPKCANPECTAYFDKLREGNLFRFQRHHAAGKAPANSHSVEHAWLCQKCCGSYIIDYRDNQAVLVALAAPQASPIAVSMHKRTQRNRPIRRRSRSRRAPVQDTGGTPLLVLAIAPAGNFGDRN